MKAQGTRISDILWRLSTDVTAEDRTYCCKKLKTTKVTISNFLNGRVTNNDLGVKMIELFKQRIAAREEKLKALCPSS